MQPGGNAENPALEMGSERLKDCLPTRSVRRSARSTLVERALRARFGCRFRTVIDRDRPDSIFSQLQELRAALL